MYCHYKNDLQLTKFVVFCSPFSCVWVSMVHSLIPMKFSLGNLLQKPGRRENPLWKWLRTFSEDHGPVFDAGFRTAEQELGNIEVYLQTKPCKEEDGFFKPVTQRRVTRWRGVIERVNKRLKVFRLLSLRFPNSSLPICRPLLQCCHPCKPALQPID
jgi:hypothetical protein